MDPLTDWLLGGVATVALAAVGGALKAWRDLAEHRRDHLALVHRVTVAEEGLDAVADDVKQSRHDLRGELHRMTLELEHDAKEAWKAMDMRIHDLETGRRKR